MRAQICGRRLHVGDQPHVDQPGLALFQVGFARDMVIVVGRHHHIAFAREALRIAVGERAEAVLVMRQQDAGMPAGAVRHCHQHVHRAAADGELHGLKRHGRSHLY